jgi:hypothetical protein
LIIQRDTITEDFLTNEIKIKLNKVREGIHMSDLLSPKKAYWQKVKPLPPEKKEIIYWLSGQAHESVFLHVSGIKHGEAKQWNGIWYTPDAFMKVPPVGEEILTEMKTSRRGFVVKEGEEAERYAHYLKQLRYYCAVEDREEAGLFVWYLTILDENRRSSEPDYFFYRVKFTKEELEETRNVILSKHEQLVHALETNDISPLPNCESWMCYREIKTMVTKPRCLTCNREFEKDWGIDKHITSKTGKDKKTGEPHEIVKAVYATAQEPRCKYAKWCNSDMYDKWLVFQHTHDADDDFGKEDEL